MKYFGRKIVSYYKITTFAAQKNDRPPHPSHRPPAQPRRRRPTVSGRTTTDSENN